jgi:hypothetical protein
MPNTIEPFPFDVVFLADAPGQAGETKIGSRIYIRGETYHDVPVTHYSRGGFHTAEEIEGMLVIRKRSPKCGIVLGTAPCMWDDLERAPAGWDIIAVNGAGFMYLAPIALWCSAHGKYLTLWMEKRRNAGAPMTFKAYGNFGQYDELGDVIAWNKPNGNGSSGLYAVLVALELGYQKLVLCGIPLEGQERFDYKEDSSKVITAQTDYQHYRLGWNQNRDLLQKHVRSMSGWTKELLGEPDAEWLNE